MRTAERSGRKGTLSVQAAEIRPLLIEICVENTVFGGNVDIGKIEFLIHHIYLVLKDISVVFF